MATFAYLEYLHHIVLTTKASTYDLYRALARATDGMGGKEVAWRYRALMRMQLQWRHLKLLKRSGRGHDPTGVEGTKEGELVIQCPSCPHAGINLPVGWELDTMRQWLYAVRLAMDANFRLKEQLVSSHSRDPGLCDGEGYFVRRVPYEMYVLSRADEADVSILSRQKAVILIFALDKSVCWIPGYCSRVDKIRQRSAVYWSRRSGVR